MRTPDTEPTNEPAPTLEQARARSGQVVSASVIDRTVNPHAKTMIRDLFGTTAKGRPDTAAAAAGLGVTRSTVQRWLRQGLPKTSPKAAELKANWQNSTKGRSRSISPAARQRIQQGGPLRITAVIKISDPDPRNGTPRSFNAHITAEEGRALYDAILQGDEAAHSAMWGIANQHVGGDADFDFRDITWK